MKNINKIGLSIITTLLLGLSGCGGGGSSTTPPATSTGYLVDANVSGVSYTSGSQSGTTDTSGKFTYEVGSKIIFTIGGVKLGEFDTSNIKSDKIIYPAELAGVERNNTTDTKVLQIAQFLQSLDSDNNPDNGITINETVRTNLSGSTLDFTSGVVAQSDLNNTIQTVAQKTIRTQTQVLQHYRETLQSANITLPNLAPNTSSQTINTNEDVGYSFNASVFTNGFSDIDGDTLTKIKITTLPTHGTLKLTDTNIALNDEINIADLAYITYAPNTNYHGTDSFKGLGYDGTVWSDEATMNITVASINDAPTATFVSFSTNEDTLYSGNLTATDADGDNLTYSKVSNPSHGVVTVNANGSFTYTPNTNKYGTDSFSYKVNDGEFNSTTQSVTIDINAQNDTPTINTVFQNLSLVENNGTTNYEINVSDIDGDTVTLTVESNNTAILIVTPNWTDSVNQATYSNPLDFNLTTVTDAFGVVKITIIVTDTDKNTTISFDVNVLKKFQSGDTWKGLTYNTVTSPHTGKVWLDRNLGASQVCTAFDDAQCYGDYYQWGRNADGHEKSNSTTTTTLATDINSSGSSFILNYWFDPYDWAENSNNIDDDGSLRSANWSKTDGSSVCPVGFRVPTEAELKAEITGLTGENNITNSATAFSNFLKLPSAGYRDPNSGSLDGQGSFGHISWSSSPTESYSLLPMFSSSRVDWLNGYRAAGISVRCVKN